MLNSAWDSADARVAFQAMYDSRFPLPPQLQQLATPSDYQRRLFSEETRGVEKEPRQVVDREVIGRQAFLLDEPLRHAADGRMIRAPLQHDYNYDGASPYRGELKLWELLDNEPMSRFGWRIGPEPQDLQGYQEHWIMQQMATGQLIGAERGVVGVMNVRLQNEAEHGDNLSERLAEEMYHMYINEEAMTQARGCTS